MIKNIIIYILIGIIIFLSSSQYIYKQGLNDLFVDYFTRGYVRACQDKIRLNRIPKEKKSNDIYFKIAKEAIDYITQEVNNGR